MRYKISHVTTYEYDSAVPVCQNIVCLSPRKTPYQNCLRHRLTVLPEPTTNTRRLDFFGNALNNFSIEKPHNRLKISSSSTVILDDRIPPNVSSSPGWESIAEALTQDRSPSGLANYQFAFPSNYVPVLAQVRKYALESFATGRPILDSLMELNARIHADFQYDPRATTVQTPVDEVFQLRRGVCQDLAHLMICALRSIGLAARYVSGYLRTYPPEGQTRLTGADASHAWISVFCGEAGWVDVDPTNNMLPNTDHITIGWGRDYHDVCPVAGMFIGGGQHKLSVAVDVVPMAKVD